ncbi:hypothetical protein ASC87_15125 [Rhizobacter sp. Root1221]|nr:hypothetical protein ASC87_15125 [Rhizobacter sp. Root1221]
MMSWPAFSAARCRPTAWVMAVRSWVMVVRVLNVPSSYTATRTSSVSELSAPAWKSMLPRTDWADSNPPGRRRWPRVR